MASLLSACATTPALHSQAELNRTALSCGLALGELVQEEDARQLLFVFRVAPTPEQRWCIARWARERGLKPVIIQSVTEPQS